MTCAPGLPAMACSPQIFISGSSGRCASFEKTTTQPSHRAYSNSRFSGGTIAWARGLASAPPTKSSSMSMMTNAFICDLPIVGSATR